MTSAQELRAAAKAVSVELSPHWRHTPRLVQTDTESIDGIAFCPKPHATSGEHEFSACDWCEVIEVHSDALASLVVSLLSSREPLAAWLEHVAEVWTFCKRSERDHALAVARALLGGEQS